MKVPTQAGLHREKPCFEKKEKRKGEEEKLESAANFRVFNCHSFGGAGCLPKIGVL